MTSKAVQLILNQTSSHFSITVEDALFTGILAAAAGINRIDREEIFGIYLKRNKLKCDENNIPFLTSIYELGKTKSINPLLEATNKLSNLACSTWFSSFNLFTG